MRTRTFRRRYPAHGGRWFACVVREVAAAPGQELGVSAWHTVDQKQVNGFAEATGDYEWFHVDVERAKREMGGTIVHGFLTLSIVPALWSEIARITDSARGYNYGLG